MSKETVNIYIADAITINNILNETKFNDLSIESISGLMEFKFQLSKIVKDKDEYIKDVVNSLKSDRFKELQDKKNKSEEEVSELNSIVNDLDKLINTIVMLYINKEVKIDITKIDKEDLFKFCKNNNITIAVTEVLYKLLIE